jgi:hypothetical protein
MPHPGSPVLTPSSPTAGGANTLQSAGVPTAAGGKRRTKREGLLPGPPDIRPVGNDVHTGNFAALFDWFSPPCRVDSPSHNPDRMGVGPLRTKLKTRTKQRV